jgi:hypothetical protein
MMKQLLEEFSEKETLTTEEINVIENEISSLSERINFCRNRLMNLSADKEKLAAMKERYLKGNFSQYTNAPSPEIEQSNSSVINSHLPVSQSLNNEIAADHTSQTPPPEPSTIANESRPDIPASNEPGIPSSSETNVPANEVIQEESDINQTLKGLFRK